MSKYLLDEAITVTLSQLAFAGAVLVLEVIRAFGLILVTSADFAIARLLKSTTDRHCK